MITLFTFGLCLILPLPLMFVEAAPRAPEYDRSGDCPAKTDKNNKIISITCCWREPVPGQILGKTYCQTCDAKFENCGDKVAQSYNRNIPDVVNQPTVPLTKQPPIESDKYPLIGYKITRNHFKTLTQMKRTMIMQNSLNQTILKKNPIHKQMTIQTSPRNPQTLITVEIPRIFLPPSY
jgi:hypothetical protein